MNTFVIGAVMAIVLLGLCWHISRLINGWYERRRRAIRREEKELENRLVAVLKEQREAQRTLARLREEISLYEKLTQRELDEQSADPGEWLIQKNHMTVAQYLQARAFAETKNLTFLDACGELALVDRKVLRYLRERETQRQLAAESPTAGKEQSNN